MINKIKDFLKNKLSRKATDELIDQDELLDQENAEETNSQYHLIEDEADDIRPPTFKEKLQKIFPTFSSDEKPSFKEKILLLREKISGIKLSPKKSGDSKGQLLSPSLTRSIDKFLSRESRETIHQVSLALIICSFTYALGKITALSLKGAPAVDSVKDFSVKIDSRAAFQPNTLAQVRSINIFRTNTGLGGKKKPTGANCVEPQQISNLPIKLVNTVVLQDSVKSLASVQVRGERILQEIREGDQISNLAKVFKISRLDVLVRNLESGVCESISAAKAREMGSPISVMSPSQSKTYLKNRKLPGIENVGNKFSISKNLIDEKMKDIASVLTQARAIKIQNPDGTISFKLTEIDPEGIFPYLGLEDQDIITSINGKPIYDMNEVMGLFAKIKNLDNLSLGIKREGSDSVKEYSIKK